MGSHPAENIHRRPEMIEDEVSVKNHLKNKTGKKPS